MTENKSELVCVALLQPKDRDYRLHGGGREVHLESFGKDISYALRASILPFVVIKENINGKVNNIINRTE